MSKVKTNYEAMFVIDPDLGRHLRQKARGGHARQRIGFQTPKVGLRIQEKIKARVSG